MPSREEGALAPANAGAGCQDASARARGGEGRGAAYAFWFVRVLRDSAQCKKLVVHAVRLNN